MFEHAAECLVRKKQRLPYTLETKVRLETSDANQQLLVIGPEPGSGNISSNLQHPRPLPHCRRYGYGVSHCRRHHERVLRVGKSTGRSKGRLSSS